MLILEYDKQIHDAFTNNCVYGPKHQYGICLIINIYIYMVYAYYFILLFIFNARYLS
jgi:hypothetical protein